MPGCFRGPLRVAESGADRPSFLPPHPAGSATSWPNSPTFSSRKRVVHRAAAAKGRAYAEEVVRCYAALLKDITLRGDLY